MSIFVLWLMSVRIFGSVRYLRVWRERKEQKRTLAANRAARGPFSAQISLSRPTDKVNPAFWAPQAL